MKYFGTDGIRGKAYEFITHKMAYSIGRSLGLLEKKMVVVARDTRESGLMIVEALKNGIIDAGLEVLDINILATPILAFMTIQNDCFGVMITASHNPYIDNGLKIFNRGLKTLPKEEKIVEDVIDGIIKLENVLGGEELAYYNPLDSYSSLFKDFHFKSKKNIVLDLANGATIKSAKFIFNQYCDNLDYIGDTPDGYNINKDVGSTHLDNLVNYVLNNKLDLGISFDGDGDRVLVVSKTGKIIDGDLLIYIFACYLKEIGKLSNNLVVLTKMSNLGIISALKEKGIETIQTDIGDKYVIRAMEEKDAILGGENSGHIINKYLFISGDGVLNAAFLLKILEEKNISIDELIKDVTFYPDRLYNIRDIDKSLVKDKRIIDLVNDISTRLGENGKVLVRASGTEPLIRISASAKTQEEVDRIIKTIEDKLNQIIHKKE
ncbi:MAG: phosphoglucosamine mutase [Tenericutes bacterium]|nr:phosphoglucosamine mutase [Mycoplasmatota bacterium]